MSGDEVEPLGSALSSTERVKARRFLLAAPSFFLALTLMSQNIWFDVHRPLSLLLLLLALALLTASLILQRSRPQGSERVLIPRNLRRTARVAGMPEVGAMIMVYGSVIVGMIFTASALFVTP
jgi:hypothetical protein